MATKIQIKRGDASIGTQLDQGEFGFKTNTKELAIGTGTGQSALRVSLWDEYSANSILKADSADSPTALTVGEQRVVGRITDGDIAALTGANLWTILTGQAGADVSMNTKKLTSVATPTDAGDAATKKYVDDLVSAGLTFHEAVLDKDVLNPEALDPGAGDRYWIAGTGAGDWSGQDWKVAQYTGTGWTYFDVTKGDAMYVIEDGSFYYFATDPSNAAVLLSSSTGAVVPADFTNKGYILVGTGAGTYTALQPGSNDHVLTADNTQDEGVKWAALPSGVTTFVALNDTPGEFDNGKWVRSTADALEFFAPKVGDLSDVDAFAGAGADRGKFVKVKSGSDALEFTTVPFADLSDAPAYSGSDDRGKLLRVKTNANELEFAPISTWIDTTPQNEEANKAISSGWAHTHAGSTGNEAHVPSEGGAGTFLAHDGVFRTPPDTDTDSFIDLTDVGESNYTSKAGYFVVVNDSPNGLEFTNVIDGGALA